MTRKEALIEAIDMRRDELKKLYELLKVDISSQSKEILDSQIYHEIFLEVLESEINKFNNLKNDKIEILTNELRSEIQDLWFQCFLNEEQQISDFKMFNDAKITNEVLSAHLAYVENLRKYYAKHEKILNHAQNWITEWDNFLQFDKDHSDPLRFRQRNYSSLNEERGRKRYELELPKLQIQLEKAAKEFKDIEKHEFTIFGEHFLQFIEAQKTLYNQSKDELKQERLNKKITLIKKEKNIRFGVVLRK